MLGNVYQSYLMISECSDGQIPLNPAAFETRTSSKYYAELSGIHGRFVFDRKDKK